MFGACVSFTVTLKEQVASGGVPFEAVQVTVVVPLGKAKPEAGTQVTVGVGHPSAVGGVKVTTAVQTLGSVFLAVLGGQELVSVAGLTIGVTSVLLSIGEKFEPVIWAVLLTEQTPAGVELLIVTRNIIATLLPGGMVPMLLVTVSPLNGDTASEALVKPTRFIRAAYAVVRTLESGV